MPLLSLLAGRHPACAHARNARYTARSPFNRLYRCGVVASVAESSSAAPVSESLSPDVVATEEQRADRTADASSSAAAPDVSPAHLDPPVDDVPFWPPPDGLSYSFSCCRHHSRCYHFFCCCRTTKRARTPPGLSCGRMAWRRRRGRASTPRRRVCRRCLSSRAVPSATWSF